MVYLFHVLNLFFTDFFVQQTANFGKSNFSKSKINDNNKIMIHSRIIMLFKFKWCRIYCDNQSSELILIGKHFLVLLLIWSPIYPRSMTRSFQRFPYCTWTIQGFRDVTAWAELPFMPTWSATNEWPGIPFLNSINDNLWKPLEWFIRIYCHNYSRPYITNSFNEIMEIGLNLRFTHRHTDTQRQHTENIKWNNEFILYSYLARSDSFIQQSEDSVFCSISLAHPSIYLCIYCTWCKNCEFYTLHLAASVCSWQFAIRFES